MEHSDSYGIVDGSRLKQSDPVLGLDNLVPASSIWRERVSMRFSAADELDGHHGMKWTSLKQNEHAPNAEDPVLDSRSGVNCLMPLQNDPASPKSRESARPALRGSCC